MQVDDSPTIRKLVALLEKLSAELPGAEQYVMVHHPAFRVGKKPFAIVGMLQDGEKTTLSINLGVDMQHQLLDDARFVKTDYIGRHGWVTVAHDALRKGELELLVTDSWRRVASKKQLAEHAGRQEAPRSTGTPAPLRRAAPPRRLRTS